jgi:hypothetical protein
MKKKLLHILNNDPATAGRPDDFLDTLAEDIQAVIILAISPGNFDDPTEELERAVEDVYHSDFGITLFNMLTVVDFPGKRVVPFSARKRIVKATIQTLLVEQCIDFACDVTDAPKVLETVTDGATLKRRLLELNAEYTKGPVN